MLLELSFLFISRSLVLNKLCLLISKYVCEQQYMERMCNFKSFIVVLSFITGFIWNRTEITSSRKTIFIIFQIYVWIEICGKIVLSKKLYCVFAGPKRGRPTGGFSIFVRMYVSNSFSCILHGQYTSDPQYFYRFRTPYKITNKGADQRYPRPPQPPYGGAEIYFGGVLMMDHSDHHRVKYLSDPV